MSFSLHDFLMNGFRTAIGNLPDYKIYANATGWLEKGVLTEADLEEIQRLLDEKNAIQESAPEESILEDLAPEQEHSESEMLSPKELEGQS